VLQARCPIPPGDNIRNLARRIHRLEHFFYPRTIDFLLDHL
jgi:phosphoribosylglycinamide formyltransferase-1